MEDSFKMSSDAGDRAAFACSECKTRKVKCDRTKPKCLRCVRDYAVCHYPTVRKRPTQMPSRPKVTELEERLVELEDKLKEKDSAERHLPPTPESLYGTSMIGTGRFEKLPPQHQIEELNNLYFNKLWADSPMLHPSRYISSLYNPPHMQPPMGLQYIVMATAASASTDYQDLAEPFYRRARYYMESDEMKDDGYNISLAHCQAWILLSNFEGQRAWFSRASLSTSRAVRLAQILGLHHVDGRGANETMLPPKDWCEREERRRTFWSSFGSDRGASSTAGWPVLIDVSHISTDLPSSEAAYQSGLEEPTITLDAALQYDANTRSSFACRIVGMHLLRECFEFNHSGSLKAGTGDFERTLFWHKYGQLENSLNVAFATLPATLQCPQNTHDANAVLTNLQLHAATICLYRSAVGRAHAEHQPVPSIESKAHPAAQQILTIIALATDIDARFRNPFVPFAAFMAAFVFLKTCIVSYDESTVQKLKALLDVMISVGMHNPGIPATLAVQLAQELDKTGIDPTALSKARPLTERMDKTVPVLGKEDDYTGAVLLCPMESRFNQSTPSQEA